MPKLPWIKKNCLFFDNEASESHIYVFYFDVGVLLCVTFLNLRCTRVGAIPSIQLGIGQIIREKFHPIIIIKYSLDGETCAYKCFLLCLAVRFGCHFFYLSYLISVPHSTHPFHTQIHSTSFRSGIAHT